MLHSSLFSCSRLTRGTIASIAPLMMACSLGLTDVPDPSNIIDPTVVTSHNGAIGLYKGSVTRFSQVYAGSFMVSSGWSFVFAGGLASDEYVALTDQSVRSYNLRLVDAGSPVRAVAQPYNDLHITRVALNEAIGALRKYGTETPPSYLGQLLAYKGFIYLMFAEMYCSGVPFSEVIYEQDIAYGMPETTEQMLVHAVALFDSAIVAATDSLSTRQLAMIGKARGLLNLGRFAEAAAVVTPDNVPTTFTHNMVYVTPSYPNYLSFALPTVSVFDAAMANRAGTNGLPYVTAGDNAGGKLPDPRVLWQAIRGRQFPRKFGTPAAPVTLANGIEARLIEAEAALRAGEVGTWSTILNTLRQTAITPAIAALPADSTTVASDTLRQNTLFRERAFWLFGTGHRLGDLRRMVRQYNRPMRTVFPIGIQPNVSSPYYFYSDHPNFEPPMEEILRNPYYKGCLNRDA